MNEHVESALHRVVDRCATREDWRLLQCQRTSTSTRTASTPRSVEGELFELLREDDMLRIAFEPTTEIASHVALSDGQPDLDEVRASNQAVEHRPIRLGRPSSHAFRPFLAGCLSAAVVCAIGCLALWPRADSYQRERPSASPSELLERYVEAGRGAGTFIEELPRIPIGFESGTADDAKPHVLFVRRFIERAEVEGAYRLANNEHGDVIPVQLPHDTIPVARKL